MTSPPPTALHPDDLIDDTPPEQVRSSLETALRHVADTLAATPAAAFALNPGSDQRRTAAVYLTAELAGTLHHLTAGIRAARPDLHAVLATPGLSAEDVTRDQLTTAAQRLRAPLTGSLVRDIAVP